MSLREALCIRPGVTAIIGGGGKTTLLLALGRELAEKSRVALCATAKMYPPEGIRCLAPFSMSDIAAALMAERLVCVGGTTPEGKLTLGAGMIPKLEMIADYVLCEADGSKGLPLKAHAPHEPVIPKEANNTVLVVGIDGIGQPIIQAAHRPELYAELLGGAGLYHIVTAADAARIIKMEALHTAILINKAETPVQLALARELAADLRCRVAAGSLQKGDICLL